MDSRNSSHLMKGSSTLHKREFSSKAIDDLPAVKKRRSKKVSYMDSLEKKPEEELTRDDTRDYEDDDNSDEQDDTGDNKKYEAEYLLGDENPSDSEEELQKGLPTKDTDDDDENNESLITRHFSHGYHLVHGKMGHGMEDYIFAKHKNINGYDMGFYAIFDGHSGHDVAKYLRGHLFKNILHESDFWKNPVRAIKRAFQATDDEILENIADSRGGSTAVAAILINRVKLLVANVGDSRAILCRNGVAKPISVDHEPEKEKDLVESRGGFVCKLPGNVPRVDGQLAMTRAFGDGKLKEHITVEPDVMIQKIDEDTEFIILASDGLWKVMTNQLACDCIRDIDDAKTASKMLIKEALSLGSCDDISCIVVTF